MENVKWTKYDLFQLREACARAECWVDVTRELGISDSTKVVAMLRKRARDNGVDVSHFLSRREFSKRWRHPSGKRKNGWANEEKRREKAAKIENIVPHVTSWSELSIKLGYVPSTHQFRQCQGICEEYGFDTSHFIRNVGNGKALKWTEDTFFVENCTAPRSATRKTAIRLGFLPTHCFECGLEDMYNGKPITLELDHIDGIWNNNSKDNLRWLCPNCHSQTKTYRRRNSKRE